MILAYAMFCIIPFFFMGAVAFPNLAADELSRRAPVGFDPKAQAVSVTGDHRFIAPTKNDFRGPCAGLNALANHGYISRNGYTSIAEVVSGGQAVYNMGSSPELYVMRRTQLTEKPSSGPDILTFLGVIGVTKVGDGQRFSIGGPPPASMVDQSMLNLQAILLGSTPSGLSQSHNNLESDASPTRGDLYQ